MYCYWVQMNPINLRYFQQNTVHYTVESISLAELNPILLLASSQCQLIVVTSYNHHNAQLALVYPGLTLKLKLQNQNCCKEEEQKKQGSSMANTVLPYYLPHQGSRSLTMKFWRLMGFMTTGGPAVRGQAWSFLSVASHHSLLDTVVGIVPDHHMMQLLLTNHRGEFLSTMIS
jgi:hypothetical protein